MDVTMPQLGETVTEGTITRWFKQVGEKIAADEPLFEVSTDKVDSEVPAPAGRIRHRDRRAGRRDRAGRCAARGDLRAGRAPRAPARSGPGARPGEPAPAPGRPGARRLRLAAAVRAPAPAPARRLPPPAPGARCAGRRSRPPPTAAAR